MCSPAVALRHEHLGRLPCEFRVLLQRLEGLLRILLDLRVLRILSHVLVHQDFALMIANLREGVAGFEVAALLLLHLLELGPMHLIELLRKLHLHALGNLLKLLLGLLVVLNDVLRQLLDLLVLCLLLHKLSKLNLKLVSDGLIFDEFLVCVLARLLVARCLRLATLLRQCKGPNGGKKDGGRC